MKKLVIPALLLPSVAMAGVILVDDGAPPKAGGAPVALVAASSVAATPIVLAASSVTATQPPIAAPAAIASSPAAEVPMWTLRQGHLVSRELQVIGDHFGWHVDWLYPREIVVPADTSYSGDFASVATATINTLKSNGLLINATFYNGNKYLVVRGAGTTPQ